MGKPGRPPKKAEKTENETGDAHAAEAKGEDKGYTVKDERKIDPAEFDDMKKQLSDITALIKKFTQQPSEVHDGNLSQRDALPITEIGNPGPIEKVSESDFVETAALEEFMNEVLTIRVAESSREGDLDIITPAVNGINQPIIRGKVCKVKRKYVEALARCRVTNYEQETPNPQRPEVIQMKDKTAVSYPFEVLHDPNPKGPAWLKAIQAQY